MPAGRRVYKRFCAIGCSGGDTQPTGERETVSHCVLRVGREVYPLCHRVKTHNYPWGEDIYLSDVGWKKNVVFPLRVWFPLKGDHRRTNKQTNRQTDRQADRQKFSKIHCAGLSSNLLRILCGGLSSDLLRTRFL